MFKVAVNHGFAAYIVAVGLQVGAVDVSDQGLAQVELVDPEVDLEELVHQEQQAPLLGVSVPACVSLVQTWKQLMSSPATSSSLSLVLLFPFLLHQLLICTVGDAAQVQCL